MNLSNDQLRHKANIRGGMTVQFMEEDVEARSLERIMCLNTGVQHYLNTCFKADKLVTQYTNLLKQVGNCSASHPRDEIVDLRKACIDINFPILSGDAGRAALSDYCEIFIDFDGESWAGWGMDSDSKFTVCCDMVCVMQDIFYRLILKLDTAKINLFDIAMIDDQLADDDYDVHAVRAIATTLRQRAEACEKCVDVTWTMVWLARLLDFGFAACRRAHTALCDALAVLRVTSTLVEKKHLVGQEAKPRKRGVCIACDEIGGFVFKRLIEHASTEAREAASDSVLGKHHKTFQKCLGEHLLQGHADRRSQLAAHDLSSATGKHIKQVTAFDGKLDRRKIRAYDMFIRKNFHEGLEGDSTFQKRKVLDARWKSLLDHQKHVYNRMAEDENDEAEKFQDEDFVGFIARQHGEAQKHKQTQRYHNERLRAVQCSIQKIVNHELFDAGTAMHSFDKGIKPGLVLADRSLQQVSSDYKDIFAYDFNAVPNPGDMSYFKPCSLTNGGCCKDDLLVDRAAIITWNLYDRAKAWKNVLPVILEFGVGDLNGFVMLGRMVGSGEVAFFSELVLVPKGDGRRWDCCDLKLTELPTGKHTSIPTSSHKYFSRIFQYAAALSGDPEVLNAESLLVRRWLFERESDANHFRVRLLSVESETNISCIEKQRLSSAKRKASDDEVVVFGLKLGKASKCKSAKVDSDNDDGPVHSDASQVDEPPASSGGFGSAAESANDASESDADGDDAAAAAAAAAAGGSASDAESEPLVEPWNAVGLKEFHIAPKGAHAKCFICKEKVAAGSMRLEFRSAISNSMRDQSRCHATCFANASRDKKLPVDSQLRDVKQLRQWLRDPTLVDVALRAQLEAVLDTLGGSLP